MPIKYKKQLSGGKEYNLFISVLENEEQSCLDLLIITLISITSILKKLQKRTSRWWFNTLLLTLTIHIHQLKTPTHISTYIQHYLSRTLINPSSRRHRLRHSTGTCLHVRIIAHLRVHNPLRILPRRRLVRRQLRRRTLSIKHRYIWENYSILKQEGKLRSFIHYR